MRVRRALVALGSVVLAVGVVLATVWLAVPAAERPEEGAADPILWLRRPAMQVLRSVGLAPRTSGLDLDPWLPCGWSSASCASAFPFERIHEAAEWSTDEIVAEPVYRGLLWRVGSRITVTCDMKPVDGFTDARLQVWARVDGSRILLAEGRSTTGPCPGSLRFRLCAFAPGTLQGYRYTFVRADGGSIEEGGSSYGWE